MAFHNFLEIEESWEEFRSISESQKVFYIFFIINQNNNLKEYVFLNIAVNRKCLFEKNRIKKTGEYVYRNMLEGR